VAILRRHLPPATFLYTEGSGLRLAPDNSDLVATALAHATWTSDTYEQVRYRLPGDERRRPGRNLLPSGQQSTSVERGRPMFADQQTHDANARDDSE